MGLFTDYNTTGCAIVTEIPNSYATATEFYYYKIGTTYILLKYTRTHHSGTTKYQFLTAAAATTCQTERNAANVKTLTHYTINETGGTITSKTASEITARITSRFRGNIGYDVDEVVDYDEETLELVTS